MLVIGHDPGVSGALVVMKCSAPEETTRWREIIDFRLIPTYKDKTRNRVDAVLLSKWMSQYAGKATFMTERVGPMPKDTPTTAWTFGAAEESALTLAQVHRLPIHFIQPKKWQAAVLNGMPRGDRGQIKASAVLWASQHFPELREALTVKKNSGMADAACIAELGRRLIFTGNL
jgi:hypothetical protein